VYVCTVNDYLAKRDFEQMSPVLVALGLTVGLITFDMEPSSPERRKAYHCDVTYCTCQVGGERKRSRGLSRRPHSRLRPIVELMTSSRSLPLLCIPHRLPHCLSLTVSPHRDASPAPAPCCPVLRFSLRARSLALREWWDGAQDVGFDYLRDNLADVPARVVLRPNYNFALIDEADALLIDECKNPMIISHADSVRVKRGYASQLQNACTPEAYRL
jgi:hypothetical protein